MAKAVGEKELIKLVRTGQQIIVRAKNGDCYPQFIRAPSAYNCTIGKTRVAGTAVRNLCRRHIIKCTNPGWFTEGTFGWNSNLRDERGRFLAQR